jgi:hypothetical protein
MMKKITLVALGTGLALSLSSQFALAANNNTAFPMNNQSANSMPAPMTDRQSQDSNCMCMCQTETGPQRMTIPYSQVQTTPGEDTMTDETAPQMLAQTEAVIEQPADMNNADMGTDTMGSMDSTQMNATGVNME